MALLIDSLLILLIIGNIFLLGSSRLAAYIRVLVAQGLILGALTVAINVHVLSFRFAALAIGMTLIKGVVLPLMLLRAIRLAQLKREVEPLIGYSLSLLIGTGIVALSLWLTARLPLPPGISPSFVLPVAIFTTFVGAFLCVARIKAITQVIAYIVLENGIYLFGVPFIAQTSLFIELGLLLDLTVGIFVMGIILHHISREFDTLNVSELTGLRDSDA